MSNERCKAFFAAACKTWIPRNTKKGALSAQLGIPEHQNIPMGLLDDIKAARIGMVLRNGHGIGKREIKVTRLLKQRANLARTLKRMRR